jgi:hypothetical protein
MLGPLGERLMKYLPSSTRKSFMSAPLGHLCDKHLESKPFQKKESSHLRYFIWGTVFIN